MFQKTSGSYRAPKGGHGESYIAFFKSPWTGWSTHLVFSAADVDSPQYRRVGASALFVDLLKWDVPVIDGRYEVDQFDDVHATYLILAEADGTHLGSARLLPTTRPHILDSFYSALCEDTPPRAANIFEITRFCLDRRLSGRERRQVRDTLVTALANHALAVGITSYSAIAEMGWFQQILAFGWHCMPLGLPRAIDGRMLAALRIEITPETPALLAAGRATASALRVDRRVAA